MNHYFFNELEVGLSCEFSKQISSEDMDAFASICGDENPLHMDEDYAIKYGFKTRVVFGMLTASLFSTLGGMYLPGEHCLIQGVEIMFSRPVYIGDEITVKGKITEMFQSVKQAVIKVEMYNQNNEKILRGKLKVGVLDER